MMKIVIKNTSLKQILRIHNLQNDLPVLPKRMKIKKCNKLVCNIYDKNNFAAHIRTLKQALNHGLLLKSA